MADIGPHGRVIHGIGQITNQNRIDTPFNHLLDSKCSVEDTHIGVDAKDQHGPNATCGQKAVDLFAVVRNDIELLVDSDSRVL
mgnify:CR=1 FL=1